MSSRKESNGNTLNAVTLANKAEKRTSPRTKNAINQSNKAPKTSTDTSPNKEQKNCSNEIVIEEPVSEVSFFSSGDSLMSDQSFSSNLLNSVCLFIIIITCLILLVNLSFLLFYTSCVNPNSKEMSLFSTEIIGNGSLELGQTEEVVGSMSFNINSNIENLNDDYEEDNTFVPRDEPEYLAQPRFVRIVSDIINQDVEIIKAELGIHLSYFTIDNPFNDSLLLGAVSMNIREGCIEINQEAKAAVFECYRDDDWEETLAQIIESPHFKYVEMPLFTTFQAKLSSNLFFAFINNILVEKYREVADRLIEHIAEYIAKLLQIQRGHSPTAASKERVLKAIERTQHHPGKKNSPAVAVCFNRDDPDLLEMIFEMPIKVTIPNIGGTRELVLSNKEREAQIKRGGVKLFMKCFKLRDEEDIRRWLTKESPNVPTYKFIWQIKLLRNKESRKFNGCAIIMFNNNESANVFLKKYPKVGDGRQQTIFFEFNVCSNLVSHVEIQFSYLLRKFLLEPTTDKIIHDHKFRRFGTLCGELITKPIQHKYSSEVGIQAGSIYLQILMSYFIKKKFKKLSKKIFFKILKFFIPIKKDCTQALNLIDEPCPLIPNLNETNAQIASLILLVLFISDAPVVAAGPVEIKMLSLNIGRKIEYNIQEIEELWDLHKPDVFFIQELRNTYEELSQFVKEGRFFDKKKKRNDIYMEIIAKNRAEIIEKKKVENQAKVSILYNNDEDKNKAFDEINRATNLNNNVSCAILHNEKIQKLKVRTFHDNIMKRFIIITIETNDNIIMLCNIYSPPEAEERELFTIHLQKEIERIKKEISEYSKNKDIEIILGGDFNANNNPLDRILEKNKRYQEDKVYSEFLNDNNLFDIYRHKNKERKYTFERGEMTKSKIDHWLTTKPFFSSFSSKIHEINKIYSDCHAIIELKFNIEDLGNHVEENHTIETKFERSPEKLNTIFKDFTFSDSVNVNHTTENIEEEIDRAIEQIVKELSDKLKEHTKKEKTELMNGKINFYNSLKKKLSYLNATYIKNTENYNYQKLKEITKNTSLTINLQLDMKGKINDIGKQINALKKNRIYKMNRKKTLKLIEDSKNENRKLTLKQISSKIKYSGSNSISPISYVRNGDEIIIGKEKIIKCFEEFWKDTFKKKDTENYSGNIKKVTVPEENLIKISKENFIKLIKELKNDKSPGPDGITNEVFKCLKDEDLMKIYKIYEMIWNTDYIPKSWKRSTISLINKGNDIYDVNDYRPIALQNVIMKIFAKIIKLNLSSLMDKNYLINKKQFGFKNEIGTTQAIQTMIAVIEDAKQFNNEIHACLIDFSKAFDSVDWDFMFNNMRKRGYSEKLIRIFHNYLKDRKVSVKTPVGFSEFFDVSRGTPQGDPLSSLFFLIFIDVLLSEIDEANCGYVFKKNSNLSVPQITFADDLTIITNTNEAMQKIIDIVNKFAKEGHFLINPKKTIYTYNNTNKEHHISIYQKNGNEMVQGFPNITFRYLGVYLDLNLDFKRQNELCIDKLKKAIHIIKNKQFNVTDKVQIINNIILPKVMYAMKFIPFEIEAINEMDKIISQNLARVIGAQYII